MAASPADPPPYAWTERYNTPGLTEAERQELLSQSVGFLGTGAIVRAPFHCDLGGNITLGPNTFLNFGCVILDVAPVVIGAFTAIGPGVQILTSDHPRDPTLRRQQVRYGLPVSIGSNVWIGAGAIILPGITIGDDAIVGAGSVVTKDVAGGTTVMGSPARARG